MTWWHSDTKMFMERSFGVVPRSGVCKAFCVWTCILFKLILIKEVGFLAPRDPHHVFPFMTGCGEGAGAAQRVQHGGDPAEDRGVQLHDQRPPEDDAGEWSLERLDSVSADWLQHSWALASLWPEVIPVIVLPRCALLGSRRTVGSCEMDHFKESKQFSDWLLKNETLLVITESLNANKETRITDVFHSTNQQLISSKNLLITGFLDSESLDWVLFSLLFLMTNPPVRSVGSG